MSASATRPRATPSKHAASPRVRDRAATESRIVEAAIAVLAEHGFTALGVNEVARRAGVDKKLVNRYFGGMDGVIDAIGARMDLWLATDGRAARGTPEADYAALMARLLTDYSTGLRGNVLVLRLLAWELVEPSAVLSRLDAARSQAMQRWMGAQKGTLSVPEGIDAPAINALLLAGIHYLALREKTLPAFAGVDVSDARGWRRVQSAAALLLQRAYSPGTTAAGPAHQAAAERPRRTPPGAPRSRTRSRKGGAA
ncbi:MAG: TetR/AcrR family transcriptional regulator [Burkholderiales bacterium]|nr:TetR/AcrR family transcriptional regulator [Burkholderiales bacterium]